MGLKIWLPLNGSLKNQGTDNITIVNNGATVNDNGKIGKCYSFDGNDDYINLGNIGKYFNGNPFSITFWIYSLEDGTRGVIFSGYGLSSTSNFFALEINGSYGTMDNYLRFDWLGSDKKFFHEAVTPNIWVHLAVVYNGNKIICYKNGEFFDSATTTLATIPTGNNYYLGRDSRTGTTALNGRLNDFRLYDHALSPQEVKKISQGLVLHYPLDRNGFGQNNIVKNSKTMPTSNFRASGGTVSHIDYDNLPVGTGVIRVTNTGSSTSRVGMAQDGSTLFVVGHDYTESCWVRASEPITSLFLQPAWAASNKTTGNNSSAPFTVGTEWSYFKWTGTLTGEQNGSYSTAYVYGTVPANGWIEICGMKVEEGSKATPWCPNVADSLATLIKMNSNVVKDISGYQNNGTINGTLSYSINTPKYLISSSFNGSDNAIQTPDLKNMITDKTYTISCWTYKTVIGTKGYQTIYGGPSGFELEARSGSTTTPLFRIHNWGGGTTAYEFDNWYHFCFVHNDENSKLYINGELKLTGSSISIPSGNYFIGAWKTATQQNYDGLISDFRIYCTALSADEVKDLYKDNITD